eukprot:TRINITY_DN3613_c0_g1_i1.p1 TRINITY_DN3613_c0_g1~~TRINITY_DN3613_c0_g1_i1.p1  ORF type:complete len:105 (-),score=16.08 TRINITY_DN3613_c0_g1_i1:257-571(-)
MTQLTIFYDGTCPLCAKEMNALKKHDKQNLLKTVDIYSEDFSAYPEIDAEAANNILHAINNKGQLLLGLDVTYKAWQLMGRGWIYAPLRWKLVKPLADSLYLKI